MSSEMKLQKLLKAPLKIYRQSWTLTLFSTKRPSHFLSSSAPLFVWENLLIHLCCQLSRKWRLQGWTELSNAV